MIKVNFAGKYILKPGFLANPWWDKLNRILKRDRGYTEDQVRAFLMLTDTLIRLNMHEECLWRARYVK